MFKVALRWKILTQTEESLFGEMSMSQNVEENCDGNCFNVENVYKNDSKLSKVQFERYIGSFR